MLKHIHIGKKDLIGHSLKSSGFRVISHHEINNINLKNIDKISISAFDPNRKNLHCTDRDIFIDSVCELFPKEIKVLYFSSLRQLDNSPGYEIYRSNKESDIKILKSHFKNVSVCFLPNIVCSYSRYTSHFIKTLKKNYDISLFKFDTSSDSSWNFIMSNEISKNLMKLFEYKTCTILSHNNTKLGDIYKHIVKKKPDIHVNMSDGIRKYPQNTPQKKFYTEDNLGLNLDWLDNILL